MASLPGPLRPPACRRVLGATQRLMRGADAGAVFGASKTQGCRPSRFAWRIAWIGAKRGLGRTKEDTPDAFASACARAGEVVVGGALYELPHGVSDAETREREL